jgi:hypothetical protein
LKEIEMTQHEIAAANGRGKMRLLSRDNLDGRTHALKRFDAIAKGIAADLGGEDRLSTVQKHLLEAFAGAAIAVSDINARLLSGGEVDLLELSQMTSTLVRIASRIGIKRIPRDIALDPLQYANSKDVDE